MIANTKARMDKIVSDNLNAPPLMPCVHHWIIQRQSDGQSLGICKKCDEHKVFIPPSSKNFYPIKSGAKPKQYYRY